MAINNVFDLTTGLLAYYALGDIQGTSTPNLPALNNSTIDGVATSLDESDIVAGYNYRRFGIAMDGAADFVTIGDLSSLSIQTISFWAKSTTTTESFIQLKSSTQRSIEVSTGTIATTGLTSATIYNNGKQTSTLQANLWNNIVITFSAVTDADNVLLGAEGANFYDGVIEDVQFWSTSLTLLEIELLNKRMLKGNEI